MLTKVQKWGNSLAVRIPKVMAEEIGISSDSTVEIRVMNGQIHIIPAQYPPYEFDASCKV